MNDNKLMFKSLAVAAARLADSIKALDIKIYDIAGKSDAAYFAMISTVESQPQMRAVEDEISVGLKRAEGLHSLHRDGLLSRTWKVMDYGGLIVHIFEPSARAFYALDRLYDGCAAVEWQAPARKAAPKKAPAKKAPVKKAPVKKAAGPRKKK